MLTASQKRSVTLQHRLLSVSKSALSLCQTRYSLLKAACYPPKQQRHFLQPTLITANLSFPKAVHNLTHWRRRSSQPNYGDIWRLFFFLPKHAGTISEFYCCCSTKLPRSFSVSPSFFSFFTFFLLLFCLLSLSDSVT